MSKTVTCPVKRFEGDVVFKDPIPYLTVLKFERAARSSDNEAASLSESFIPIVIEAVESWKLKNFPENPTAETFPGTPRASIFKLVAWLLNEFTEIYKGNEDNDPNE